MTNIREITIQNELNGTEETHIIEEFAPAQFRSMPKAVYEAQQVEHLTEIVADETASK